MSLSEKLDAVMEDKPKRMGMYAVQTNHPGLMKSLKKKEVNKVDRSFLANDDDAEEQHIAGKVDVSGGKEYKKEQVVEKIDKRLAEV